MATPLEDVILQVASGPAEVETEAGRVTMHNPADLIEVDKHLTQQAAQARGASPWSQGHRIVPPGARGH